MLIAGALILDAMQPPTPGWVEVQLGRITDVQTGACPHTVDHGDAQCIISPGFIDAHLHLPQIDAIGHAGLPLLKWLEQVIFPAEARWADSAFARSQIGRAYARMVREGTLGYAGYLSSHPTGVAETLRVAQRCPLRGIVGQVLMDRNAPDALLNQPGARLARSARGRLDTSLNPRFAPACSDQLLTHAGERLRAGFPKSPKQRAEGDMGMHLFLQTHLAESKAECELVRSLFPDAPHYTGVYDAHGLLTEHTLLAHCVHLSDDEWNVIAERNAVVVHCPTANTFLQSGVFDLAAAREHDVRLALGSDIAAGPDVGMPRVARAMIETATMRAMLTGAPVPMPTPGDAWNMITRDNANALGWRDAGRLEVGASADLLVIRPPFDPTTNDAISRLLYQWDCSLIEQRILAGKPWPLRM